MEIEQNRDHEAALDSTASKKTKYSIALDRPPSVDPQHVWIAPKIEVIVFLHHGELKVFSSLCPHMGAQMAWNRKTCQLECPWHGFALEIQSGKTNHPRYRRLKEFRAEWDSEKLTIFE